ncbi:uncharacterized protein LOC9660708 isoform X2 [Selaginella moellendorffii]|uniref:uncharacterized protein LOC9660708 isoform X2 n=1 Tax=Selaginella moellendorffii TaxID=88036 RepID=UPI000D1C8AFC|nr:uncharacterized protein LOC9660708 isoform X2 [Selaginella moellendorffii]|eukprot:XP_024540153.1 uncharacterized protein LOC9660708 isoform X2 [Selaginella moellendorffii]
MIVERQEMPLSEDDDEDEENDIFRLMPASLGFLREQDLATFCDWEDMGESGPSQSKSNEVEDEDQSLVCRLSRVRSKKNATNKSRVMPSIPSCSKGGLMDVAEFWDREEGREENPSFMSRLSRVRSKNSARRIKHTLDLSFMKPQVPETVSLSAPTCETVDFAPTEEFSPTEDCTPSCETEDCAPTCETEACAPTCETEDCSMAMKMATTETANELLEELRLKDFDCETEDCSMAMKMATRETANELLEELRLKDFDCETEDCSMAMKMATTESPNELLEELRLKDFDCETEDCAPTCETRRVKRKREVKAEAEQSPWLKESGMEWKNGRRCSTRYRSRPLEYWRGEKLLYGRVHKTMPTLIGIKHSSPMPPHPKRGEKPKEFKVESFVPDQFKHLVKLAAI